MRARERYHLSIELVDPAVLELFPGSPVNGAWVLVDRVLGLHLVGFAAALTADRLPARGPQARVLTITERDGGETVLLGGVEAGDDGQRIAAAVHRSWKRDDEDAFLETATALLGG